MHAIRAIRCVATALLLLPSYTRCDYTEWCEAAPELGKPEFAVCVPFGDGTANYMIEILPSYAAGVNLR